MRIMLLSFKPSVYNKLLSGIKIYEHRKVFPDEPIKAYLYAVIQYVLLQELFILGKEIQLKNGKRFTHMMRPL